MELSLEHLSLLGVKSPNGCFLLVLYVLFNTQRQIITPHSFNLSVTAYTREGSPVKSEILQASFIQNLHIFHFFLVILQYLTMLFFTSTTAYSYLSRHN